jgi:hypothetical protein
VKWLTNREWLDYDESNDIMTCKIWQRWWWWWLLWRLAWWSWKLLAYMNIQENKILHLNCVNFFWSSKKLFGPVKVLPLLDQMSSEVQGTFGMTVILEVILWFIFPLFLRGEGKRQMKCTVRTCVLCSYSYAPETWMQSSR